MPKILQRNTDANAGEHCDDCVRDMRHIDDDAIADADAATTRQHARKTRHLKKRGRERMR